MGEGSKDRATRGETGIENRRWEQDKKEEMRVQLAKSSRAMCEGAIFSAVFWSKSIPITVLVSCNILEWCRKVFILAQFNIWFVVVWLPQLNVFFPNLFAQNDKKNGFHANAFYHFLALHVRHQSNGNESVLERELMFDFLVWYIKKRDIHRCVGRGLGSLTP